MLTKQEIFKVTLAGALVGGLAFGADALTTGQVARISRLKLEASGTRDSAAINEAHARKAKIKKMKSELGKWTTLLVKVEKYLPKSKTAPIQNEQVARLIAATRANLEGSSPSQKADISWSPPAAEGTEGATELSEDEIKAAVVKYGEESRTLTIKGDYASWLDFLLALEQLNVFYRFKELKIKTLEKNGKPDPQTPLHIALKLASYHVLEFPSDRKSAEE